MVIQYSSYVLPTNDEQLLPVLARKYTSLRIKGLRQSPQSFSATIESEEKLTEDEQIARVKVKKKWIIVIIANDDENEDEKPWYEKEWVAQATVYGPNQWKGHIAPFKTAHKQEEHLTDKQLHQSTQIHFNELDKYRFWHMTALYVDVNHRKKGLANQICVFAFNLIKEETRSKPHLKGSEIRIIIKPTNTVVIKMYENLGFVGQEQGSSLSEANFAAGDQSTLPLGYQDQQSYTTRTGLIMTNLMNSNE